MVTPASGTFEGERLRDSEKVAVKLGLAARSHRYRQPCRVDGGRILQRAFHLGQHPLQNLRFLRQEDFDRLRRFAGVAGDTGERQVTDAIRPPFRLRVKVISEKMHPVDNNF